MKIRPLKTLCRAYNRFSKLTSLLLILLLLLIPIFSSAQVKPIVPLTEPNHEYGESEIEQEIFPSIDSTITSLHNNKLVYTDDSLQAYLESILDKLMPESIKSFDIELFVILDPEINAGMYPNGKMIINSGLIAALDTEGQLAFIMAHELAHFIYRHSLLKHYNQEELVEKYRKRIFKSVKKAEETEGKISEYSQLIEYEADSLGLSIYLDVGYSPLEAVRALEAMPMPEHYKVHFTGLFSILLNVETKQPLPTHPRNEDRIAFLKTSIADLNIEGTKGEENFEKIALQMAQENLEMMKNKGELFDLLDYITELEKTLLDTTAMVYKEVMITKAELYYAILESPLNSGFELYRREQIEKKEDIVVHTLKWQNKVMEVFNKYKLEFENNAKSIFISFEKDEQVGCRANKHLGLLSYNNEEFSMAEEYLNKYLNCGEPIQDKRYIKYLLSEIKNKK